MNAPDRHRPPRRLALPSALRMGTAAGLLGMAPASLFHRLLDRIDAGLESGSLEARLPDGTCRLLGGRAPGHDCIVNLRSWRALVRLALGGSVGWYVAWEAGEWESPDPVPLFALFVANAPTLGGAARPSGLTRHLIRALHALNGNSRRGARRNIAYHYDLGNAFYALWLDTGMNYSSALYTDPKQDLESAQTAKIDALLDRLHLQPGALMLEIGCGWGGLAERALERVPNLRYEGLTLSAEQKDWADRRLAGRGSVHLRDYRDHVDGPYDAIASVEMVEAIGEAQWPEYLRSIRDRLRPGGRAGVQLISMDERVFDAYRRAPDFIQTYIFPGGCLIAPDRFRRLAEAEGLLWQEERRFGRDYARTLAAWRYRFDAAVDAGRLPHRFDAHFVRLWRYYLSYCEGGFLGGGIDVHQVTLVRPAATA